MTARLLNIMVVMTICLAAFVGREDPERRRATGAAGLVHSGRVAIPVDAQTTPSVAGTVASPRSYRP
jgi:hypothetical protein